jgi:uncharacterized protein (DUF697 family)
MSILSYVTNVWDILKEADLRPLRDQALRGVRIAIVGDPGSGRSTLADQMRNDPARPQYATDSPVLILDLASADQAATADLIILMIDSRKTDTLQEQELVKTWHNAAKKVLVFINQIGPVGEPTLAGQASAQAAIEPPQPETVQPEQTATPTATDSKALAAPASQPLATRLDAARLKRGVVWGSALDQKFITGRFTQEVVELIPDNLLALGRFFPLFRVAIARYMINDTCFTNAAYSLSTGLAQIIPILDIPMVLTDMVILTKNQLFMVYKLGLTFGFSTRWQDYVAEFGSVLGSGFIWRQIARSLVGLVPLWGIAPKTAIAYAGTYVVGNAVLQWYLTGRHLSTSQMHQAYNQALARGREVTHRLTSKRPHLRLPKPRIGLPKRKPRALPAEAPALACANCGRSSAADARFCQYCGQTFDQVKGG